jgi:uncharacterized membrane protein
MTEIVCRQPDITGLVDCPAILPFDFYIAPNISLGRLGSVVVLLSAALPAAGIELTCAVTGHWPVTIFSGLAFGGLLLGFVCARRSLRRLERISLSEGHVVIERTSAVGPRSYVRVPLLGLRLERFVDPDYGVLLHRLATSRSTDRYGPVPSSTGVVVINQSSDEPVWAEPCDQDNDRSIPAIPSIRRAPSVANTSHQVRKLSLINEGKP